ncbi:hypothetical protein AWC25_09205 [Mycobacterium sherrisii]|uniref:Short-chain dehydrogenase n=1 Tax=Mycobacterium sherrisii TaxID=243061 RepID=A0A1E3T839_9MYCO|nr:hypothetical protein BHQ21_02820 [Mycobacterium sherrisii]ORW77191.1 hypothetical protein AWC25_09205 [Mycobacterium sherrisii]
MTCRTIVITGASDGIGAAAARRLSRGGDRVPGEHHVKRTIAKPSRLAADPGLARALWDGTLARVG